jgi:subtilisin family serine protease
MDRTHPDLKSRIGIARNFVTNDEHFDSDIHGTAVAGIIAANANDGVGIVGLAPDADLLALKACWQDSLDDIRAQCNSFTLAKALTFAVEQHVDIINMSLGGPNDPLLALLVELALARGIVVVAAEDTPGEFPADMPGVIAVRAASRSDTAAPTANPNASVIEVAARELLSTSPGGHYDYFSGSSMGAARVAGLAALLRQEHGSLSTAQMLKALDQQLTALGAHATVTDGQLVTHAPNSATHAPSADSRAQRTTAVRIEGT